MKPVELEIFLQDGLTPGLKKAGQTVSSFTSNTKRQLKDVAGALQVQREVVRNLEKQYRELEKSLKSAAPGAAYAEIKRQMAAVKTELDGEKAGLQELTSQQRVLKLEADNTGASLRQQLKSAREEIATLLIAYRSLSEEEKQTAQGKELARYIDELTEKAGVLNDAIGDTSQAISNAASDTRGFDQLAGGVQLVVDGFGLATAGAQAFGMSEENLLEVQTKLQTVLVASNALTSMQVNLQKQSALMQGVVAIQTKAAAAAETIRTWAVGKGTVATILATIAQKAFNATAKANPYVLLAAAVLTVVGALYAFAKGSDEAKKASEERRKALESLIDEEQRAAKTEERLKDAQESVNSAMMNERSELELNIAKTRDFNGTKEQEKTLVDQLNNKYGETMGYFSSVADWYNALIQNSEAYCRQMVIEARTRALANLIAQTEQDNYNIRYDEKGNARKYSTQRQYQQVRTGTYTATTGGAGGGPQYRYESREIPGTSDLDKANASLADNNAKIQNYKNQMSGLVREAASMSFAVQGSPVKPGGGHTSSGHTPSGNPAEERIKNELELAKQLREIRWQNEQEEIEQMADGAERRRRQAALDYEKALAEIEEQRTSFAELNKELNATGLNDNGVTEEQQAEIDRANRIAVKNRDKALQEINQLELQHMEEYLKEYGTYQQRRLAISEEYDRKIAAATDEWEKKSLERERDAALQNIEIEAIKQSIDWGSVFGGFGTMFREELEPTIAKLRKISETEEFRNSSLQDQQILYELIAKLEEANTSWDSGIFNTLGEDLTAYQTAMRNYMDAQEKERQATTALTDAKKKLAQAEAGGNADAISLAKDEVATATANMSEASDRVRSFGVDVQDASGKLQTSTAKVNNMFNTLVSSLTGLKSGSLQGVGESLMGLDKLFNNSGVTNAVGGALAKGMSKLLGNSAIGKSVAEALGNSGLIGEIISAVLSLLDILKDGIGALVSSLIDTVLNAVSGIIKNLLNGKMFLQIGKSLIDGIAGIFDAITFGGFTSWFDTSNAKEVKETIDSLTERNELLQTAIEDLTDEIKASKGTQSVSAYRDAYKYQQETNANYLGIAQAQAGYHGSHHSWNYYWGGFTPEQIARLSKQIGRDWNGDIWNLSPEEMKMLRVNVDMWKQIQDTGKGGYGGSLTEKLDDYIDQAGKLEELTTQLYEGLTGITFDSMYDSFIDQLMDMDATAEDFADNISEYFMRAMLSNKIGEMYADKLEEWWKKFGKAMEDNDLTEEERKALSDEYMKYVDEAIKLRDGLAAATGYDPDKEKGKGQSGKAGSFNAMSQDQGTKLEGLFTSVQGHVASIDGIVEDVAKRMSVAEGYLSKIADNTEANAKSAEEIKDIIEKIARDGIRTR